MERILQAGFFKKKLSFWPYRDIFCRNLHFWDNFCTCWYILRILGQGDILAHFGNWIYPQDNLGQFLNLPAGHVGIFGIFLAVLEGSSSDFLGQLGLLLDLY